MDAGPPLPAEDQREGCRGRHQPPAGSGTGPIHMSASAWPVPALVPAPTTQVKLPSSQMLSAGDWLNSDNKNTCRSTHDAAEPLHMAA
jgi:hypothetical protein